MRACKRSQNIGMLGPRPLRMVAWCPPRNMLLSHLLPRQFRPF